jgi:hypothetical protein
MLAASFSHMTGWMWHSASAAQCACVCTRIGTGGGGAPSSIATSSSALCSTTTPGRTLATFRHVLYSASQRHIACASASSIACAPPKPRQPIALSTNTSTLRLCAPAARNCAKCSGWRSAFIR